jgi:hypothetical protein
VQQFVDPSHINLEVQQYAIRKIVTLYQPSGAVLVEGEVHTIELARVQLGNR